MKTKMSFHHGLGSRIRHANHSLPNNRKIDLARKALNVRPLDPCVMQRHDMLFRGDKQFRLQAKYSN